MQSRNRDTGVENKYMSTKGKDGGGGGRTWKTGIHTYTLLILYVKQITNENTGFPAGSVVKKKNLPAMVEMQMWV